MTQRRSEDRRSRRQARLVAQLGAPAVALLVAALVLVGLSSACCRGTSGFASRFHG